MFGSDPAKREAHSVFQKSVGLIANVSAVMTTFFATPFLYGHSEGFVRAYVAQIYGEDSASFGALVYGACLYLLVFGVARATIAVAIILGGLTLATRFIA